MYTVQCPNDIEDVYKTFSSPFDYLTKLNQIWLFFEKVHQQKNKPIKSK